MKFDAVKTIEALVPWIQAQFKQNGGKVAVVGISGGKDSSVVAALCAKALGKENVLGVLMPCGAQADIADSRKLVAHLEIPNVTIDINGAVDAAWHSTVESFSDVADSETKLDPTTATFMSRLAQAHEVKRGYYVAVDCAQMQINLPARIRMTTLYAVAAICNGRVANTCNLSEDYVGYATKFGDAAGDFSPLSQLTVTEVRAIGHALGLPTELVDKTPTDGLCGKTDEESLGMPYSVIDNYLRTGRVADMAVKCEIEILHERGLHKLLPMPQFQPDHARHVTETGDVPSQLREGAK